MPMEGSKEVKGSRSLPFCPYKKVSFLWEIGDRKWKFLTGSNEKLFWMHWIFIKIIRIVCSTEKGSDLKWPHEVKPTLSFFSVGIMNSSFTVSTRLQNEQSFNNLYLCGGSCSRRKWHMGSSVFFLRVNIWNHVTEKERPDSKVYANRKLSDRTWLWMIYLIGWNVDDRIYLDARWYR